MKTRRVTANLPVDLLAEATAITGENLTATLIYGLQLVRRGRASEKGRKLKGTLDLAIDLEVSRERAGR